MARQPPVCQNLLVIEASRSCSDTPCSVGLLWTSDQSDADNIKHSKATDKDPRPLGGIRNRIHRKRAAADPRHSPRGHWNRPSHPHTKSVQLEIDQKAHHYRRKLTITVASDLAGGGDALRHAWLCTSGPCALVCAGKARRCVSSRIAWQCEVQTVEQRVRCPSPGSSYKSGELHFANIMFLVTFWLQRFPQISF